MVGPWLTRSSHGTVVPRLLVPSASGRGDPVHCADSAGQRGSAVPWEGEGGIQGYSSSPGDQGPEYVRSHLRYVACFRPYIQHAVAVTSTPPRARAANER